MKLPCRTVGALSMIAALIGSAGCSDDLSEAPAVTVSGTITVPGGAPLEGVALTLEVYVRPAVCSGTPHDVRSGVSGAAGEYSISGNGNEGLPAQNACVRVTAEPAPASGFQTTMGQGLSVTLRTPPNAPEVTSDIELQPTP